MTDAGRVLHETLDRVNVILEMFPKCYYCGRATLTGLPIGDLVAVAGHNRLAHRDCLAAEASEGDDVTP